MDKTVEDLIKSNEKLIKELKQKYDPESLSHQPADAQDKDRSLYYDVLKTLRMYIKSHPDEDLDDVEQVIEESRQSVSRKHSPGHSTASGLVLHQGKILLIHHNSLQVFLQPGGHLEPQDKTVIGGAIREVLEETGLKTTPHPDFGPGPIHIDKHPIPANKEKGEPDHDHYDFMFVLQPEDSSKPVKLQTEEVSGYQWIDINQDFKQSGLNNAIPKIRNHLSQN